MAVFVLYISISFMAITNEPYNLVCECCKEIDQNHTCIFAVKTICTSVTIYMAIL